MKISQAACDHYWEKGWTVVEGVFSHQETEAIAQVALEVADQDLAADQSSFTADHSPEGQLAPRKIAFPFTKHPAFRTFALDPRLTSLVTQLLGQPPLLATDQVFMKPPRFGSAKPYHQDNFYFRLSPRTRPSPPGSPSTTWTNKTAASATSPALTRAPFCPTPPSPASPTTWCRTPR